MHKTTKASIATATGIVLLLGGAGSLAYWTDTANTGSGSQTISAGTLTITPANSGAWTKGLYDNANVQKVAPAAVADITTVKIVPGNKLVYTQVFNVLATGNDLYFTVTPTNGSLSATALGARLTSTFAVGAVSPTGVTIAETSVGSGIWKVGATGTGTATITRFGSCARTPRTAASMDAPVASPSSTRITSRSRIGSAALSPR